MINQIIKKVFILTVIAVFCVNCTSNTAPLEYAPSPEIVRRALELSLQTQYNHLSSHLQKPTPQIEIKKIDVIKISPQIIDDLPNYKLTGKYEVLIISKKKKKQTIKNKFEINLQRQKEGQTWVLLMLEQHNLF